MADIKCKTEFLDRDIRLLKGVGQKRAALYAKIEIHTFGDLLRHYPRGYRDFALCPDIMDAELDSNVAFRASVDRKTVPVRIRGGRIMQRVFVSTENGHSCEFIYFNNKYAADALETGKSYVFYGKLQGDLLNRKIFNPVTVKEEELNGLSPQYPLTEGLSSRMISTNVKQVLSDTNCIIPENLPQSIISLRKLASREDAVRMIHFPADEGEVELARNRLIYEELLVLSLGMKMRKNAVKEKTDNVFAFHDASRFCSSLPFELTGAQKRAIGEISHDLSLNEPMTRLLQGDVGSGKTAVAAAAVWLAARNGYQSAVMAPTEVLAAQHAETFRKFLEPFGITVALLTGSVKGRSRAELLRHIGDGSAQLVVGTHALISEGVEYHNLGLVVADEQHRFGVAQRAQLSRKGKLPHTLVMSATPIPRTLSLIIYGDLDISVLDELPKGRKPVKTLLVDESYRERYLGFVRKNVDEGHQVYIVCPLVEESESLENTVSASEYFEELRNNWLSGISMGLLHGKMTPAAKNEVMEKFQNGEIKVLVSTTVVEVGVDCPNATLIIIENAERFGLSTLHQLRGRVGRGGIQSWCVLVSSKSEGNAFERLQLLCKTDDGFAIAREDLRMRGPGDFLGSRQHGLPTLAVADLADDEKVLYEAGEDAGRILESDPGLGNNGGLRAAVDALFAQTGSTLN